MIQGRRAKSWQTGQNRDASNFRELIAGWQEN